MNGPGSDCADLENQISDLQQDLAILTQILDEEPDLSPGTVANTRRRMFEIGNKVAALRAELERCRSSYTIEGVEATQGTQYFSINGQGSGQRPDNSVPLVAGRTLILRVYINSKAANSLGPSPVAEWVTGRLTLNRINDDGPPSHLADVQPLNGAIFARPVESIDRRRATHTLNFRLPALDCRGTLRYRIVVFRQNPVVAFASNSLELESLAAAGNTSPPVVGTVTFLTTSALRIRLVRIAYRNADRGFDLAPPSRQDFWSAAEVVLRTFPVPRIDLVNDSVEVYDGDFTSFFASGGLKAQGTTGTIFEILTRLRNTEGLPNDVHYLALIPGYPANWTAAGWSISGRQISEVDGFVLAQELAHDSGFPGHAPCGGPSNEDPDYPIYRTDIDASIGEVGYNVATSNTFDPGTHHDFMSYCRPQWISPYTYGKLLNRFRAAAATLVRPTIGRPATEDTITVAFSIASGKVDNVRMFDGVTAETTRRSAGSRLAVRTYDGGGTTLDTVPVWLEDVYITAFPPRADVFAEIPVRDGSRRLCVTENDIVIWETELSEPLVIHDANIVVKPEKNKASNVIAVTSGLFGKGHFARIDYSFDNGLTWETVGTTSSPGPLRLEASSLRGGNNCRIRVVVADGFRVMRRISESFYVPARAATNAIIAPLGGATISRGSTVRLFGECIGLAPPLADPANMNWSSGIDGFLGSGYEVLLDRLSTGRHRITLASPDGLGAECQDSVFVHVMEGEITETTGNSGRPASKT